jgi:hypothetical protein
MSVCMHGYIAICNVCMCMHACMHVCIRTHKHRLHVCIYKCECIHINMHVVVHTTCKILMLAYTYMYMLIMLITGMRRTDRQKDRLEISLHAGKYASDSYMYYRKITYTHMHMLICILHHMFRDTATRSLWPLSFVAWSPATGGNIHVSHLACWYVS